MSKRKKASDSQQTGDSQNKRATILNFFTKRVFKKEPDNNDEENLLFESQQTFSQISNDDLIDAFSTQELRNEIPPIASSPQTATPAVVREDDISPSPSLSQQQNKKRNRAPNSMLFLDNTQSSFDFTQEDSIPDIEEEDIMEPFLFDTTQLIPTTDQNNSQMTESEISSGIQDSIPDITSTQNSISEYPTDEEDNTAVTTTTGNTNKAKVEEEAKEFIDLIPTQDDDTHIPRFRPQRQGMDATQFEPPLPKLALPTPKLPEFRQPNALSKYRHVSHGKPKPKFVAFKKGGLAEHALEVITKEKNEYMKWDTQVNVQMAKYGSIAQVCRNSSSSSGSGGTQLYRMTKTWIERGLVFSICIKVGFSDMNLLTTAKSSLSAFSNSNTQNDSIVSTFSQPKSIPTYTSQEGEEKTLFAFSFAFMSTKVSITKFAAEEKLVGIWLEDAKKMEMPVGKYGIRPVYLVTRFKSDTIY